MGNEVKVVHDLSVYSKFPELVFRFFDANLDYQNLAQIQLRRILEDDLDPESPFEGLTTPEELKKEFYRISNFKPTSDILIVQEKNKDIIGFTLNRWWFDQEKTLCLLHDGYIVPEWRSKGIGTVLIRWSEKKLRNIAKTYSHQSALYCTFINQDNSDRLILLMKEGYFPSWGYIEMEMELSKYKFIEKESKNFHIEIRPAKLKDVREIWNAELEAFRKVRGYIPPTEKEFKLKFNSHDDFYSVLAAYNNNQIAGVLVCDKTRFCGVIDSVSVRKPWRNKGIAQALIRHGFELFAKHNIDKVRLICEASHDGPRKLYTKIGFTVKKEFLFYMKPFY